MWIDRAITLLDDSPTEAPGDSNALGFERIFLLIVVTEYWTRAVALWETMGGDSIAYLALATVFVALGWRRSTRRLGFAGLALVQLLVLSRDFPQAGNHAYLELIFCLLLALLDPRDTAERQLLIRSVRWVVILIFFWSGIQKLVYGYYFSGEQLAYSLRIESFRPLLALLLPAAEVSRLAAYSGEIGEGPYVASSLLFVTVSNAVYAIEIALAFLLLIPKTRRLAAVVALCFLAAVETAAREVFFGLVFGNAVLSFLRADVHARLVSVFAVVSLYLVLARLGVLPGFVFY